MGKGLMHTLQRLALLFVALGFVVGIAVGLALGWFVAPVSWYDTDPSDLRVEHQHRYVQMAADSYAVNGDAQRAWANLLELTDDDTGFPQVADLVDQVASQAEQAGDAANALRVRRMVEAAQMNAASQSPSPVDAAPSEPYTPPRRTLVRPPGWVLALIGLGVMILAAAMVVYVMTQMAARRRASSAYRDDGVPTDVMMMPGVDLDTRPEDEAGVGRRAVSRASTGRRPTPRAGAEQPDAEVPPWEAEPEATPTRRVVDATPEPSTRPPSPRPTAATPHQQADSASAILGTFEAEYRYGNDDFDCSFSIEAPDGEFLGECGLGVGDVLEDEDGQQVDAFELWLFDKEDIRTVSKLLLSEYAFHDEEIQAKLSAKSETVLAEPGRVVLLETRTLRVQATLNDQEYLLDDITPRSVFSQLSVALTAERA